MGVSPLRPSLSPLSPLRYAMATSSIRSRSPLLSHRQPVKLALSMIAQTYMGIMTLYDNGLTHDDLHGGNILNKRLSDRPGYYFLYHTTDKRAIAVQHQSHLFALTDYGFMKKKGQYKTTHGDLDQKNMLSDFARICKVMNQKIEQDFPHLGRLMRDIGKYASQESTKTVTPDTFSFLQELFFIFENNHLLDEWQEIVKFQKPRRVTAEFDMK